MLKYIDSTQTLHAVETLGDKEERTPGETLMVWGWAGRFSSFLLGADDSKSQRTNPDINVLICFILDTKSSRIL